MNLFQFLAVEGVGFLIAFTFIRAIYRALQQRKDVIVMTIIFLYGVLIFTPEIYFGQRSSDEYGPIESIKKDYCMHVSKEWYTFHLKYSSGKNYHVMCDVDIKKGMVLESELYSALRKSPDNSDLCSIYSENHVHHVKHYSHSICLFEETMSHWGSQHPECEITSVDVPYRTHTILYSQRCPAVEWPVWHYLVWSIFYVWSVLLD